MDLAPRWFIAIVLVVMSAAAELTLIEPPGLNRTSLMKRTVKSMHQSLDYLASVQHSLTVDGLLGVIIVKHQTDSLINAVNHNLNSLMLLSDKSHLRQLNAKLLQLNEHAKQVISASILQVFFKNPLYFQAVGRLFSRELWWQIDCQPRHLTDNESSFLAWRNEQISMELTEELSDVCLSEILNGCHISTFCWKLLLIPKYKDYRLAHQVLYLTAAKAMNCISATYKEIVDQKIDSFCKSIYQETLEIQQTHYKQEDQDLFMENIAFCGYNGFTEFRTNYSWLMKILGWQSSPQGCYQVDLEKVEQWLQTRGKPNTRAKRRETVFGDGCSLHKTSMALAATSIYLQQLVFDFIHRINFKLSLCPQ